MSAYKNISGKRIHTNEENCFSKRFMSVTPPLNSSKFIL